MEMDIKGLIKINVLLFAGLFSVSVNAVTINLGDDPNDIFGTFLGNDGDAVEFTALTGISGVTELFRDNNFCDVNDGVCPTPNGVFDGAVTKVDFLDYLVVKFDGVFGVYDVRAYDVGDVLGWATADFASDCALLVNPNGPQPNCGAATSHVDGYGVVPVPAAVWLFASGLLGLIGVARKRA